MPGRTPWPSCSSIMRPYLMRNRTQDIPLADLITHVRLVRPASQTDIKHAVNFLIRDLAEEGWTLERHKQRKFTILRLRYGAQRPREIAPYQDPERIRARFYGNLQPRYGR